MPITARQGPIPSEPTLAKRVVFGPRVRGTDQHTRSHLEAQPYGLKLGSKRPKTGLSAPEYGSEKGMMKEFSSSTDKRK